MMLPTSTVCQVRDRFFLTGRTLRSRSSDAPMQKPPFTFACSVEGNVHCRLVQRPLSPRARILRTDRNVTCKVDLQEHADWFIRRHPEEVL